MKLTRVTENSVLKGQKCKLCSRVAQDGQSVAYRRYSMKDAPAYEHYFVMHVRCMKAFIDKAEPDVDEIAFEETRRRILATGELWQTT